MKRICQQCEKEFEISEGELNFYKGKNLEPPKRCPSCRNKNKKQMGAVAIALVLMLLSFLGKEIFSDKTNTDGDVSYNNVIALETEIDTNSISEDLLEAEKGIVDVKEQQFEQPLITESLASNVKQDAQTEDKATLEAVLEDTEPTYNFRNAQYLTEHFQKHGSEFPYDTEEEYLQGANKVINHPDSLHKLEAEDGDDVYYLESTNEFVIVSTDGYIRTYFKPSKGIDYYNRQ